MADESVSGENLPAENKRDNRQGLEKFGDTAVAFDDMIVQVGRGIARAQEMMDLSQVEFQKKAARAFKEGRMKRLDLKPSNAYVMPETKLEIKVGMSMSYPEGGGEPSLSAVPLNAASTNENDIDVEAATEIKLRFVSVPSSKEPEGPSPSALTREDAVNMAIGENRTKEIIGDGAGHTLMTDYAEDARLWRITWLKAREPEVTLFIDDRKGKILDVIYRIYPPRPEEIAPVGEPLLKKVAPPKGKWGDRLTLSGDNFLTLSGQTLLTIDGRPVPLIRHSMKEVTFKVPAWAVRGDLEVITPLGKTGETGREIFTPFPSFRSFNPAKGHYDAYRMKGTRLTIYGDNLRPGCNIRFATGATGKNVKVLSPGMMEVEIPEGAGTGPLTLTFGDYAEAQPLPFIMLHSIESFSPRQARVGQEVVITGSRLDGVEEIVIGKSIIPAQAFTFRGTTQIRFSVPPDAQDGRIILRESSGGELIETKSRDIFYIVPRITEIENSIVSRNGLKSEVLAINGEGLDADPQMMTIIFEGKRDIIQSDVVAVSGDRKSLTVRVPDDCVSGFVRLIRKRVYSGFAAEDTSSLSKNKITVLTPEGMATDVLIEERFDGDLSKWQAEAGNWTIDEGSLVSEGTARLAFSPGESINEIQIYADILNAETFGFYFLPGEGALPLQMWINLATESPNLTWSMPDGNGGQDVLGGAQLPQFPGENYFVQVKICGGRAVLYIDQEEVHSIDWPESVTNIALLGNSNNQRWDNVIIMKKDCLSLPDPDFYRFGEIPAPSALPIVTLDSFQPTKGGAGTEVTILGSGLSNVKGFYFGGVVAELKDITDGSALLIIPDGALTGPIEAEVRGGLRVSSGDKRFMLPPVVTNLVPAKCLAGSELQIIGVNLPYIIEEAKVVLLGLEAEVLSASPSMMTVRVPDVTGKGPVSISCSGFTAKSPLPLEVIREKVVADLLADAENADWITEGGRTVFGASGEESGAAAASRASERMEDGNLYGPVLYLHPPSPSYRALRGEYPAMDMPEGRLELRLELGMLWSAAPTSDDIAEVDGVIFEVSFLSAGEEITLLPRTACIHDGSLEGYVVDAGGIAGKRGQLVISVFPGRNGLRDDVAITKGDLVQIL